MLFLLLNVSKSNVLHFCSVEDKSQQCAAETKLMQMQDSGALRRADWAEMQRVLALRLSSTPWCTVSSLVVDEHPDLGLSSMSVISKFERLQNHFLAVLSLTTPSLSTLQIPWATAQVFSPFFQ